MNRLKQKWGIESNFQLIVIFVVFAITGSASVYVAKPFLAWVGLDRSNFPDAWWSGVLYWSMRILIIFPIYQVLLVFFGWFFGQFRFFWGFEKKMLQRMGLGFLFKEVKS
ncbi:MAG: diacylglyceryl transferase [Eudoraea sp.]|nr:diacylglyceryl transferase [Eudoraea sp.]